MIIINMNQISLIVLIHDVTYVSRIPRSLERTQKTIQFHIDSQFLFKNDICLTKHSENVKENSKAITKHRTYAINGHEVTYVPYHLNISTTRIGHEIQEVLALFLSISISLQLAFERWLDIFDGWRVFTIKNSFICTYQNTARFPQQSL